MLAHAHALAEGGQFRQRLAEFRCQASGKNMPVRADFSVNTHSLEEVKRRAAACPEVQTGLPHAGNLSYRRIRLTSIQLLAHTGTGVCATPVISQTGVFEETHGCQRSTRFLACGRALMRESRSKVDDGLRFPAKIEHQNDLL